MWHNKPQGKPLSPYTFTCRSTLQGIIDLVRDPAVSYILNAGTSLGLFQDTLLLPCVQRSCNCRHPHSHLTYCASTDHRWYECGRGKTQNPGSGPQQLHTWSACQCSPLFVTRVGKLNALFGEILLKTIIDCILSPDIPFIIQRLF